MNCSKRRYRDRIAAEFTLSQIKDSPTRAKAESRAYRCPKCKGWHLTSQA